MHVLHSGIIFLIPALVQDLVQWTWRTGSSYTCNPAVTNTDTDYLVYVLPKDQADVISELQRDGWELCDARLKEGRDLYNVDIAYGHTWYALRKGEYNIILSWDDEWMVKAMAATELCKALNVMDKEDRKAVFRIVRDGNPLGLEVPTSVIPKE